MNRNTKTIITIICLIFLYPLGLFFMWKWMTWKRWVKWLITLYLFIIAFLGIFFAVTLIAINPSKQFNNAKFAQRLYLTPAATKYNYSSYIKQNYMDWCQSTLNKYENCLCVLNSHQNTVSEEEFIKLPNDIFLSLLKSDLSICDGSSINTFKNEILPQISPITSVVPSISSMGTTKFKYPADQDSIFMSYCINGKNSDEFCTCFLNYLKNNISFEDLAKAVEKADRKFENVKEFTNAAAYCIDKR